jgi:hypothetical protein
VVAEMVDQALEPLQAIQGLEGAVLAVRQSKLLLD